MPTSPSERYEAVIGLEVHAQLSTATKIFCGCSTAFGAPPNTNVCPVCLGMPGSLPVLNRQVVEYAVRLGIAVGCRIAPRSVFARKNYFYPDLPKGYQISQYEEPICLDGHVDVAGADGSPRRIGITRIHMEEDAGKSVHDAGAGTLVDANRCGTPLLEIVSEPDLRTAQEAVQYLAFLRQTVRYLGICDGNMEEGSFRCDANVSVRLKGESRLGTKTEVKNMNSFSNVERAIEREIRRQIGILDEGGAVVQQTLLWDAERGEVHAMRSKEEAHDYRYFPDPDLAPVLVNDAWVDGVRRSMPELPAAKRARFAAEYGLPEYDAGVLTQDRSVAEYFERTVRALSAKGRDAAKTASNWVMTDVLRALNERQCTAEEFPVSSERLAALLDLLHDGTVNGTIAKELFAEMLVTPDAPKAIVERKGMAQISDTGAIGREIDAVLARFPAEIARFRAGEAKLMGFFVGETMKVMKGKGNPKLINELLRTKLEGTP